MDGFGWHPKGRLIGPDGVAVGPALIGAALIADRPAGAALAQALARGSGFCVGGVAPVTAGVGMFETLTGGSTGVPRRVVRSVDSWVASFAVNAGLFGIGPGVRVAVLGRLSHSLALYGALEGVHLGAEVHLLDGVRPDRAAAAVRDRGVEVIYGTPAQLRMLVDAGVAWPDVVHVIMGGSKLDAGLRAALGGRATEFYGAAETSFITLADADTPEGSVGRAYPGVEIDVREGVIWVRSPYTAVAGWVSVGEMGRLDGGYLFLSGRAGRMVTIADQNVFPEEIEAFLGGLPGVRNVAVIPRPDRARGHVIEAVMQGDPAQTGAIMLAARARLGPLLAPRAIRWVAEWPVLASGKTDLAALT